MNNNDTLQLPLDKVAAALDRAARAGMRLHIDTTGGYTHLRTFHVRFPIPEDTAVDIGRIPGVSSASSHLERYSVEVTKGELFDWEDELMFPIIDSLISAYDAHEGKRGG